MTSLFVLSSRLSEELFFYSFNFSSSTPFTTFVFFLITFVSCFPIFFLLLYFSWASSFFLLLHLNFYFLLMFYIFFVFLFFWAFHLILFGLVLFPFPPTLPFSYWNHRWKISLQAEVLLVKVHFRRILLWLVEFVFSDVRPVACWSETRSISGEPAGRCSEALLLRLIKSPLHK